MKKKMVTCFEKSKHVLGMFLWSLSSASIHFSCITWNQKNKCWLLFAAFKTNFAPAQEKGVRGGGGGDASTLWEKNKREMEPNSQFKMHLKQ